MFYNFRVLLDRVPTEKDGRRREDVQAPQLGGGFTGRRAEVADQDADHGEQEEVQQAEEQQAQQPQAGREGIHGAAASAVADRLDDQDGVADLDPVPLPQRDFRDLAAVDP